jgi:hypothetical protein
MQGFQPDGLIQFFQSSGFAYRAEGGRKFSALTKQHQVSCRWLRPLKLPQDYLQGFQPGGFIQFFLSNGFAYRGIAPAKIFNSLVEN